MVQALQREMPKLGIGTYSFDFPAHGESPVDGMLLRISHCLEDLKTVEKQVVRQSPEGEICYFGSSFGAYILLLYLAEHPRRGQRAFLRSAAVDMHHIFENGLMNAAPEWQGDPQGNLMQEYFIMDYAYTREMRITRAFLSDLKEYDLFRRYPKEVGALYMIHGGADSTAAPRDAARFARLAGAELQLIPGAEHRLMGEGELEQVLRAAAEFFSKV